MTQIEQVKNEIERLIDIAKSNQLSARYDVAIKYVGEEDACDKILNFINSLPQETVSDFDKHIQQGDEIVTGENGSRVNISQLKRVAKKKEPVIEELEHAANNYADEHGFRVPYDGSNNFYDDVDVKASKEGFIAGANWQKEQMMKDAKEGIVTDKGDFIKFMDGTWVDLDPTIGNTPAFSLKEGQKVKLIVIKEE